MFSFQLPIKRLVLIHTLLTFVSVTIIANHNYTYQSYNGVITCSTAFGPPREPKTVEEIQKIVRDAESEKITVKVFGNKHSISDCICTTGIPVVLSHFQQFSHNVNTATVKVGTGMKTVDFLEKIHNVGCAISGAPTFGAVTIGGVIAIGVHGTGTRYPTLLSDQLVSLKFVDGQGNVKIVTKKDKTGVFNALRVSLGLLGIIYEVEIQCQPLYKLKMRNFPLRDSILTNGASTLVKLVKTHDVSQMWWFPTNQKVVLSLGNRVATDATGNCQTNYISNIPQALSNSFSVSIEAMQLSKDNWGLFLLQTFAFKSMYKAVPGRQPFYSESDGKTPCLPEATGWSHKMMSNICQECSWLQKPFPLTIDDTNVAVPLKNLPNALATMRLLFQKELASFPLNGLYFRFLKPGKGYMAINNGKDENDMWVSIEWITVRRWSPTEPKLGIKVFQALAQALIKLHEGRSHWGKAGLAYTGPAIIRSSHGDDNVNAFIKAMNLFDPKERFMNSFGERIKYGRNVKTVSPDIDEHCALNEVCFCKDNHDCGKETIFPVVDYTCKDFALQADKFPVCQPPQWEVEYGRIQNETIYEMAEQMEDLNVLIEALKDYGLFMA